MKTPILLTVLTGLAALPLLAQEDAPTPRKGQRPPPPSRLVLTLDADHDKTISASEIAGASTALATLDRNADGQLTRNEFARPKPNTSRDSKRKDSDNSATRRPPPPDPVAGVLDANHDKILSAEELANAPAALAKLDKNTDGQLTRDEFAPPPPRRPHHGPSDSDTESGDAS